MEDEDKARPKLIEALLRLRQRVAELREPEVRYHAWFDNIADAIVVFDQENKRFLDCNQAALDRYGYTLEELRSMTPHDLHPPGDLERVNKHIDDKEEIELHHYTHVTKSGERLYVEIHTDQIRYEGRDAWISVVRDITARKKAEQALQQRATQLKLLNDIGGKIAAVLELESVLERTARLVQINFDYDNVALLTVDRERDELMVRAISGIFAHLITPNYRLKMGQGMIGWVGRHGETLLTNDVETETRYVRMYPNEPPIQSELSVPIRVGEEIVGVIDIQSPQRDAFDENDVMVIETLADQIAVAIENARLYEELEQELIEREQADKALRDSEERFRSLAETASDAIIIFDTYENIVFWNQAAKTIFGYSTGETVGRLLASIMPDEFYSTFQEELKRATQEGADSVGRTVEMMGVKKDGSRFPLELTLATWETKEETFFTAIARDISERKQAAETLKRRADQLALINDIGGKIAAVLDLERVLERAARLVQDKFGYHHVALFTLDPEDETLQMRTRAGDFAHLFPPDHQLELGQGMVGWVGLHGETLLASDVSAEPHYVNLNPDAIKTRSELSVPIQIGRKVVGVFDIQSPELDAFSKNDVMVTETLADQIAVAIENARLYKATKQELAERKRAEKALQRRTAQLEALREMGLELTAQLDLNTLLYSIASRAAELLGETSGGLYLYRPEQDALEWTIAVGPTKVPLGSLLKRGEGLAGKVWESGEPIIVDDYQHWEGRAAIYDGSPITGVVSVPIRWGEEFLGVLSVEASPPHTFSSADAELLNLLASQAAIAIQNARLFEETRTRAEELAVLNELGQALTTRLSVDKVLEEAYRQTSRLMDTTNFGIVLYDPERHELNFVINISKSRVDKELKTIPADQGISGYVVNERTGLLIQGNTEEWKRKMGVKAVGEPSLCWLGVPLIVGDQLLGMIGVQSFTDPYAYDEHDQELLTAIASQVAIALQNARLFEETRTRAEELAVLNELGQALTTRLSVDEVLKEAYRQTSRLMDTSNFYIGLYDQEQHQIEIALDITDSAVQGQRTTLSADEGIGGYIVRNRTPVLIREGVGEWYEETGVKQVGPTGSLSWLGAPLTIGDQTLGAIAVQSFTEPRLYDEHDQELLTSIASQVAIALQNAYLFEETRSRAQRLAVVNRVAKVAGAILDMDDLLEAVYEEIALAFEPEASFIALYDDKAQEISFRLLMDQGVWLPPQKSPLGPGLTSVIIEEKKPIISRTKEEFTRLEPSGQTYGTTDELPASWLGVPMLVGDRVVGVINVQAYRPKFWDKEDELLLFTIADQVAVAIEKARLYEETTHRLAKTRLLQEVTLAAASTLDFEQVLARVIQALHQKMGIEHLCFVLPHESEDHLFTHPCHIGFDGLPEEGARLPLEGSVCGRVYTSGQAELIPDTSTSPNYYTQEGLPDLRSELAVPVRAGDHVVAVLNAESARPNAFSEEDLHTFEAIATQLGIVMENAQLYEEAQQELAERRRTEERLRESEEKYRASFDNARDALNTFSKEKQILDVNQKMIQLSGYSKQELISLELADLFPEAATPRTGERIKKLLQGEEVPIFETDMITKEGARIPVEIGVTVLRDCYGRDFVFQGAIRDITEHKKAKRALEKQARELARSNAELEQFAYVASHDLQEPLRMVRSYLQLLERRYKDQLDEDAQEFIWFAVDGATRMQTLINDLLTYSRVTTRAKPFEPVDCSEVLDRVLTDLKVAIEENDAVVTHEPLPIVMADPTQFKQVLQNLISNAIKFRKKDTRPEIDIDVERQGDEWVLAVSDNGIGIDPQNFERIFTIFQRLHSRDEYPGTGIGLALCKKIVERHGGRMWVESEEGQGSTFRFSLPVSPANVS